ncbi:MAG: hypothetical protein FWF10_01135 [Clostridiales bacterium]|nr:hypothetical protein [Clostridiales bacterium]
MKKRFARRLCLVLTVALMLILITGAALALSNAWGMMDFLRERSGVEVLPEAVDIVQKGMPQTGAQTEHANFSVREAIYDGQVVYIVVDAKPTRPDYLLLGGDTWPEYPISDLGPLFEDRDGLIETYAAENNLICVKADIGSPDDATEGSMDYIVEADGTLVFMLKFKYDSADAELAFSIGCVSALFIESEGQTKIDIDNLQISTLTAALRNTGTETVVSTATATYADCGVRVDKITLTGSAMAIYARIEYTVTDVEKFAQMDGCLWFEFVDANGERLPMGAYGGASVQALDESGTRFELTDNLRAAATLPSKVILRAYRYDEQIRYETHSFGME